MKYRKTLFTLFVVVCFLTTTSTLWSGEPGELVREVILKDSSLKPEEMTKERKRKIWDESIICIQF